MSRPEAEFDKFTFASYNATNAAGLSRKDIFNRTFFNALIVFKFKGTKTSFDQHVKNTAGMCLGTRPITVKGVKLNLPVYEEGTNDAAECAIMYVYTDMSEPRPAKTIFSNDVMRALDLVLELLTPNEARAWLEHDTRDKNPLYVQPKQRRAERWALLGPRTIETGAEMKEFEKWFNAKLEQARAAANDTAESIRVAVDMIANMHVYQTEFGEETNPGGFCAEATERWNAKLAKKAEEQVNPNEGVSGGSAIAQGERSNPAKFREWLRLRGEVGAEGSGSDSVDSLAP